MQYIFFIFFENQRKNQLFAETEQNPYFRDYARRNKAQTQTETAATAGRKSF
jgi:hypothetical protein